MRLVEQADPLWLRLAAANPRDEGWSDAYRVGVHGGTCRLACSLRVCPAARPGVARGSGYRDLYLQRARAALQPTLPRSEYARLKAVRPAVDRALRGRAAVVGGEWARVRALVGTLEALQRSVDASAEALVVAGDVYEPTMVPLDPLAPGLGA